MCNLFGKYLVCVHIAGDSVQPAAVRLITMIMITLIVLLLMIMMTIIVMIIINCNFYLRRYSFLLRIAVPSISLIFPVFYKIASICLAYSLVLHSWINTYLISPQFQSDQAEKHSSFLLHLLIPKLLNDDFIMKVLIQEGLKCTQRVSKIWA